MMTVEEYNRETLDRIEQSDACAGCPLDGHVRVGMDSATGEAGQTDILFMGLNPGRDEAREGLPFVGKSGTFLRECMEKAGIRDFAIVNSILCSTGNESEIPDAERCRAFCRQNVAIFVTKVAPKVIVPCGNGASALFGLPSGITGNAAKVFVSTGRTGKARPTLVTPILHPSSLIRGGGVSSPNYQRYMERLSRIRALAEAFDPHAQGFGLDFAPLPLFNNPAQRA